MEEIVTYANKTVLEAYVKNDSPFGMPNCQRSLAFTARNVPRSYSKSVTCLFFVRVKKLITFIQNNSLG